MPTPGFDPVAALTAADAATNHQADPQTLSGAVKSAGSTQEAVVNARAAVHFGNVVKEYDNLNNMQAQPSATPAPAGVTAGYGVRWLPDGTTFRAPPMRSGASARPPSTTP